MKKRQLRCIVAGFDPFAGADFNPSGELAAMFPDVISVKAKQQVPVEKLLLPTCCKESWKALKRTLKKYKDDDLIVLVAGLAEGRKAVSLERVALNLRDYRIKDNNGHQHEAQKIEANAQNALFTTVPVDKIKKALTKRGVPCEVSNHAGTFVCNDIYFRTLSHQSENKRVKAALFVHVPLPKDFAETISKSEIKPKLATLKKHAKKQTKAEQLAILQEAVQLALLECIKTV
ncbi:pyroglutamyl-peptidase I [Candidatus Obscuribacterales bacterium]|nr:pyroglutamyl-peptidase I [Candidatus Obscuribacterales bacterium]